MSRLVALGVADAPRLAVLHATAFDTSWGASDFEALLNSPGVAALGVETADLLAGLILTRAVAGEAEILTLAVAPSARRRGLASALAEAAAGACAAHGAEVLWLEVAADNAAALGLYRRAGFVDSGRRPGYYARREGPAVDAVVMRRLLNTALA